MLTASKLTVFDVALVEESSEYGLPLGNTRFDLRFAIFGVAKDRASKRWSRETRGSFHARKA